MLVADITNPFFFDIIRGSQEQLKAAGFSQLLIDTEESPDVEASSLETVADSAAGVILTATRLDDAPIQAALGRIPVVCINRVVPGAASVLMSTRAAVEQAVEHLASLGHRRICYVHGPPSSWADTERSSSCAETGARLGLDMSDIGPYEPSVTGGTAAADSVLANGATAALAFNDLQAIGMLQRFGQRGVGVPDQISIVGCDDTFGATFCNPPLTTLTVPLFDAGRLATTLLLDKLGVSDLSARRETTLTAHLTIRSSTGPAPSEQASS
jgi:LacI family transcriptional regulator